MYLTVLQDDQDLGDSGAGARQPAAEVGLRGAGRGRRLPHRKDRQRQGDPSFRDNILTSESQNLLYLIYEPGLIQTQIYYLGNKFTNKIILSRRIMDLFFHRYNV